MSPTSGPKRRWGDAYALSDLLEKMEGGVELATRDFALLTLAGHLSFQFPGELVFKGGFVLRHVHGLLRFSTDIDATRSNPQQHKLDAGKVAKAIREASVNDIIRFNTGPPQTDSARSLDFDKVEVTGTLLHTSEVQVEVSYREGVVDPPVSARIGNPFYDEFEILTMAAPEMAAEKLRALAQRTRVTDLADLANLLIREDVLDTDVARIARAKFELVRLGVDNRERRIKQHLDDFKTDYDNVVFTLFPDALPYEKAMGVVWPRIKTLIP